MQTLTVLADLQILALSMKDDKPCFPWSKLPPELKPAVLERILDARVVPLWQGAKLPNS